MSKRKSVKYKGRTYFINNSGYYHRGGGTYYKRSAPEKERLLHRVKWSEHHGLIPDGYVVHHKDGNKTNNKISNLEIQPAADHARRHTKELWTRPSIVKRFRAGLAKARIAAVAWHTSPAGHEWHKQHGANTFGKREKQESPNPCRNCGKSFSTINPAWALFCSNSCLQKHTRKNNRITKICVVCGKGFDCFRYTRSTHCSRSCASQTTWLKRKPNLNGPPRPLP